MFMKSITFVALLAAVEARFGQEQCSPALADIQAVTSGGQPGQAATIAGGAISNLLAAANPCDQLKTADNIIATLGNGADAVKAAQEFINCEKNFNPFVQSTPTLCSDATLPSTAVLRGVLSKIDPSVGGADLANQLAAQSLTAPFDATGKSMADIFAANGFTNFTTKDAAGNAGAAPAGSGSSASAAAGNSSSVSVASSATSSAAVAPAASDAASAADSSDDSADDTCVVEPDTSATSASASAPAATTLATVTSAASQTAAASSSSGATAGSSTATGGGSVTNLKSTVAGVDFGECNPGMIFESGLDNRPATEFTFQAADAQIRAVQEEALNFNIITNRICDSLTNFCESNQAAKDLCAQAKTAVTNLPRIRSTADSWNTMLGFAGQNTNPDNTSTVGEPTS